MDSHVQAGRKTFNVAVVGATGAVGLEMVRMLEDRNFPVKSLKLLASRKSAGKSLKFKGSPVKVETLDNQSVSGVDVAIFSAGATVSKEFAPLFAKKGTFVIDNSSAWRMDQMVPLVVPEVNPGDLKADRKIIANPNCSTIQMVVALKPLHDAAKIISIHVATYQSVSGAGQKGIEDLENQTKAWAAGGSMPAPQKISHQIAFNLVPQIDVFADDGYTKEELKMVNETRKIMGDSTIKLSATCVRVPVYRCHSEAVWIETAKPLSVSQAQNLLRNAPGVVLVDEPSAGRYPMPIDATGRGETFVGRIRPDHTRTNGLALWVVSDNLLKGAALNAVQIAEVLVERGLI